MVIQSLRPLLHSSSVYSCHLFLIASPSVRALLFLSFIEPIFAWNFPLVSLIFLKRSLLIPILLWDRRWRILLMKLRSPIHWLWVNKNEAYPWWVWFQQEKLWRGIEPFMERDSPAGLQGVSCDVLRDKPHMWQPREWSLGAESASNLQAM